MQTTDITKVISTFFELYIANAPKVWDIYIPNSDKIDQLDLKVMGQGRHAINLGHHVTMMPKIFMMVASILFLLNY
jgi:hypothetical protein